MPKYAVLVAPSGGSTALKLASYLDALYDTGILVGNVTIHTVHALSPSEALKAIQSRHYPEDEKLMEEARRLWDQNLPEHFLLARLEVDGGAKETTLETMKDGIRKRHEARLGNTYEL